MFTLPLARPKYSIHAKTTVKSPIPDVVKTTPSDNNIAFFIFALFFTGVKSIIKICGNTYKNICDGSKKKAEGLYNVPILPVIPAKPVCAPNIHCSASESKNFVGTN